MPRPRTYLDGAGRGAPRLSVRLDPQVRAYILDQHDPRAYIEQLVRDDANLRAVQHGHDPPFPPEEE